MATNLIALCPILWYNHCPLNLCIGSSCLSCSQALLDLHSLFNPELLGPFYIALRSWLVVGSEKGSPEKLYCRWGKGYVLVVLRKMAAHATADVQTPASSKSGTRPVHRPKRPLLQQKSPSILSRVFRRSQYKCSSNDRRIHKCTYSTAAR